jgi:hypothetical protein
LKKTKEINKVFKKGFGEKNEKKSESCRGRQIYEASAMLESRSEIASF